MDNCTQKDNCTQNSVLFHQLPKLWWPFVNAGVLRGATARVATARKHV